MGEALLQVKELQKYYPVRSDFGGKPRAWVKAVDGVTLDVRRGEVLGLVGEGGCGKTTLVNTILRLEDATGGTVLFGGEDLFAASAEKLRLLRRNIQIVFQDPFWSLDPRLLLKDIVGEPLKVHKHLRGQALVQKVEEALALVGLPKDSVYRYPHEFSAGQRQRIAIARAVTLEPKLLILDEPTSSLDVLAQSQILLLFEELKDRLGMTYILISHDLGVVHYMSDRIAVMYLGKVVEHGPADEVFRKPRHPYTQALFRSIPDINTESLDDIVTLEGTVPSPINLQSGCYFHDRCVFATEQCSREQPALREVAEDHITACHLAVPDGEWGKDQ